MENFSPYLAIFLKKNANLLGVFLKQYKNGHFFKSNFWYVLIFQKVPETSGALGCARLKTVSMLEKHLESLLDVLEWFLKKAKRSQFNPLHTGCHGMGLQPKVNPAMRKTCAAASSYKTCP